MSTTSASATPAAKAPEKAPLNGADTSTEKQVEREYTREELIKLMGLTKPFEWLANPEEDVYKRGDGTPIVWPTK